MFIRSCAALAAACLSLASGPVVAQSGDAIAIRDAEMRTTGSMARSGAAFMLIENALPGDDRLVAARSDIAARVELHTHREDAAGVMRMIEVEEGFVIPGGGSRALARGGDHVMFLGLHRTPESGETVSLTLVFENAGEIELEVPVADLQPGAASHGHGHGHHH